MPEPRLTTALLPELITDPLLFGRTAVVIDILRASTTMAYALANGAADIVPCLEIEEAREKAVELRANGERILLGGERGGVRVDGFDLGNSPTEYQRDLVSGATVVFSTTNGTRAIQRCRDVAAEIWIGSFANLSRVLTELASRPKIALLCAGTNGLVSREDVLFAGAVCDAFCGSFPDASLDDSSQLARAAWTQIQRENLAHELTQSQGGRNLRQLGQDADIRTAASIDTHLVLPILCNDRIQLQD